MIKRPKIDTKYDKTPKRETKCDKTQKIDTKYDKTPKRGQLNANTVIESQDWF